VHIGDGADASSVRAACNGIDVVLSGSGGVESLARNVAKEMQVKKFVYVAGASNLMSEDGVTPVGKLNPNYEGYYNTHAPCIDAVKRSGVNFVVFCPGYMKSLGFKSNPMPKITVNRPAGGFVSFEDAAQVMLMLLK
jgi:uncharacterized protein YbjT (DUF2867 family)